MWIQYLFGVIVGSVFGFSWLILRLYVRLNPNSQLSIRDQQKKDSEWALVIGLNIFCFIVLYSFWPKIVYSEGGFFFLPAFIGVFLWLLYLGKFGSMHQEMKRLNLWPSLGDHEIQETKELETTVIEEAIATTFRFPKSFGTSNLFLIDGNNIAISDGIEISLGALHALVQALKVSNNNVHVYFDANIGMLLSSGERHYSEREIAALLDLSNDDITIVPGGSSADEWILKYADAFNAIVISNDRFRDYEKEYAFISDSKRVIKYTNKKNIIQLQEAEGYISY